MEDKELEMTNEIRVEVEAEAQMEAEFLQESVDRKRSKYAVSVLRDEKMLKKFVKFSNGVKHPKTTGYMVVVGGTMFILPFINDGIALPGVIICHVMGALMVLMGFFRHKIGVYMLKSNPQTKLGEDITYLFGNTGVKVEKDGVIEHVGSYKKIYRIWEDEKTFYVGMNEDDLLVLPKANFEVGDVGAFRDFIEEKSRCVYTWKPVRIDNVIKQYNMGIQARMTQMRMEINDKKENNK